MEATAAARASTGLDALYRDEREPMLRVAVLMVGSRAEAEEIVHDAFVVVGERWDQVANPGGYLRTTVVNGCRMALRRREVARRRAPGGVELVDAPHELVELHDALGVLSDRERMVVVLRYLVDLPDDEIASALHCRPATVRSLAHRALKKLREELA